MASFQQRLVGAVFLPAATYEDVEHDGTVVAVRQALDYDNTFRAVMVCLLSWLVGVLVAYLTGFGATAVH